MADIRPFAGIRYADSLADQFSNLIAPPYDVLSEADKQALLAKHDRNIVKIDLPHTPPKTAGPDEVYQQARATLDQWLADGVLKRDVRPAIYPYAQTYEVNGRTYNRRGLIALVRLTPFGEDVIPHERTYKGPIEDRLKLMRETGVQLSPVFGLFPDPGNQITQLVFSSLSKPDRTGTLDGVRNDLWSIIDADIERQVIDLFKARKIYIADGHHRYTTALQYQFEQQQANGGPLPPTHPANYCMFVLVSMQEPGLLIQPTHRIVGGLDAFDINRFRQALGADWEVVETTLRPDHVDELAETLPGYPPNTFGLLDGQTRKLYTLTLKNPSLLAKYEPDKSAAWQQLDVAILQRYLFDEVIRPLFAGGRELQLAYTADPHAVSPMTDGQNYKIAIMLKPTPLTALEQLGEHGEVMPQKSTYFYPKLATGMVINPLR